MRMGLLIPAVLSAFMATGAMAQWIDHRDGNREGNNERRLILDFYDQEARGTNFIRLKQQLRQQHGIDPQELRDEDLIGITLVAKSRNGRGIAALRVGDALSRTARVQGYARSFKSNHISTYDKINFENPSRGGQGTSPWQIQIQGHIKVKGIIVYLSRRGGDNQGRDIELDFNGEYFEGKNTLSLRREIERKLGTDTKNLSLSSVTVLAKSRDGEGGVSLQVGQEETRVEYIDGNSQDFESDSARTYFNVPLANPSRGGGSEESWQLHLDGDIRILKIIVNVDRERG
ncbi:MAG: hypothetical protein AB7T49_18930 [Oligoflexales bacterium]